MKSKYLYNNLQRISSKSGIIVLFLLAHLVLLIMLLYTFPIINSQLGAEAFDLKTLGYSFSEATEMIHNLNPATVEFYLFPQLFLLDILYPLLLALFLSTSIIRLSELISLRTTSLNSILYILPFLAMIFDYVENILIAIMITNPLTASEVFVKTASSFTILKGVFTSISWVIILVLFVFWVVGKLKRKGSLSSN